ncbi:hypothetical protein F2Q70_00014798 [Brassica cretica]|uniref:Formin-like protein n=1 Tax=Brassica cretica TaxID=69181 RepID=A0A8S9HT15_BRACR|nr:hypothetical protein F2Q70_00014798 [Brassica cretica]
MDLLRKLFNRKTPDGLHEICDQVFVFGSCLSTDSLEEENYKTYLTGAVNQLQEHFPDASSLVFNFRDVVDTRSVMADVLSEHGLTVMDYPRHYQGCSLLPVKVMKKILCYCDSWLSLGPSKLILLHCERGAWPVLAFMLAALLIYRKQYSDEYKTLDMICKKAPVELMHLFSPLNPIPSLLRYLQYVSRRTMVSEWPPTERALTVDCVMLRCLPDVSGQGSFLRPVFRVYGQDPLFVDDDKKKPELLYSSAKKGKHLKIYKQLFSNKCVNEKGVDYYYAERSSPKASIAIKERLRLAVVAMVPERREAGGAPPLALLVAKLATGGRGGSITSLASRGGFGALAGGCASLDATDTRVPAFAALSCLLFHDLCRGLELTQVSGGCSRELRDDSINAIPCNECGKLYRRIREVIERYGEVLVSQHRDVNRDIPLVHCLHYFSLPCGKALGDGDKRTSQDIDCICMLLDFFNGWFGSISYFLVNAQDSSVLRDSLKTVQNRTVI